MPSNLPEEQKENWTENEIVMPDNTNSWGRAINTLSKAVPLYSACGNVYTATYTNNVYNLTPLSFTDNTSNVTVDSYVDGMSVIFQCPTNNLANCSVNVNSLGAKTIKTIDNLNLPAGKLNSGVFVELKYDKTNDCFKFQQDFNKANISLDNLTEAGEKHFLNKSQITNCITEIPQRIKLELNDGTLTLKAGSKVYALDGSSYTIPTDVTFNYPAAKVHSSWILVKEDGKLFDIWTTESASDISIGSKWVTFNGINCYLPICLATHNADGTTKSGWKSIDQVFNGMGYIGSTVWVDKGVKGLMPNGRNEDCSLKNIEFETEKVLITTYSNNISFTSGYIAFQGSPNNISWDSRDYWEYNDKDNKFIGEDGSTTEFCYIAKCDMTNGVISNFQSKFPFRAVDYNDKSEISGWGMPSAKYIQLTLGASGSTYTAPANGWFSCNISLAQTSANGIIWIKMISASNVGDMKFITNTTYGEYNGTIPAKKGDIISIQYQASSVSVDSWETGLRFVYAEGVK